MGCLFCASGKLKKVRDLSASDMILQILFIEDDIKERISHVVLMGIGEPFDNYDNVLRFIKIINSNKGLDIGARHITISTCGIIPKIEKFMKEGIQVNLAISLHASNDELRNKLMPINKVYNISKLMGMVKKYIKQTNRRVTFEYIMLKGINDSDECAIELSDLLKGINCYVNLIPYNETDTNFKRTNKKQMLHFYDILKKRGINVTIRREFGLEIDAACGQLRAEC
jgi:23S rRNA (adenine2503-C2)-methyltransferase